MENDKTGKGPTNGNSDIFVAVMQKKSSVLENAIAFFQNLTIDYSANDDVV